MAPAKQPKYEIPFMVAQIDKYLQDCNADGTQRRKDGVKKPLKIPILKECCLRNDWNYYYVEELASGNEDLQAAIKKLLGWKEVLLEQGMLYGTIKHGAAIFSLKQLGWRDQQTVTVNKGEDIEDDELTKSLEEIAKKL